MKNSCVRKITNEDELNELQSKSGHVVLLLHSKNCAHCKEDKKDISNICSAFGKNSPIVFAECDVNDEGCHDLWEKARPSNIDPENYGIPMKVGLNRNNTVDKPSWHILGRNPEKMGVIMGKLHEAVTQRGGNAQQQQQQQQQQRPVNPYLQFMTKYAGDSNAAAKLMHVRSGLPDQNVLCVNCNTEDRLRSMKRFIVG